MTTQTQDIFEAPDFDRAPAPAAPVQRLTLSTLFKLARHASWILPMLRPIAVRGTVALSADVRRNLSSNATGIFGRQLSTRDQRAFAREVIGNFFDFVTDMGRSTRASVDDLRRRIEQIDGAESYRKLRAQRRGAVLVTAHMGAFEVGLAALRQIEPEVHVVFRRDAFSTFDDLRSRMRALLGVHEAPIDDGLPSLMRLREALLADHVVVMQADRAMVGQRSIAVPFLHASLRMPVGPVKLARLTNSPLVPVFVIRSENDRFVVHIDDPIEPRDVEPALRAIAAAMEKFVARFPTQWLVLERAFVQERVT